MKPLSTHAQALMVQLHQSWSRRTIAGEQEKARLIQQIAELREVAAVPSLVSILYAQAGRTSELAAAAIDQIVADCSVLDLVSLDRAVRDVSEWQGPQLEAKNLHRASQGFTGTLGVLSCNGSGYVREAAVRVLAASSSQQALPFLLIRLNDWVGPVRDAAKEAMLPRIQPTNAAAILKCLPLLFRLREQRRGGHEALVDAMLTLLLRPETRDALLDGLIVADQATRRAVFKLVSERQENGLLNVLREGISSEDTVIRLMAARGLRRLLVDSELEEALEPILGDRFMPLRREALYGFVEKLPERAIPHLHRAILDPHASIRDLARFYLRKSGEGDFAAFYREKLASGGQLLSIAVAGVGETGTTDDAAVLQAYLGHSDPRVRRAAIRAIASLESDGYDEAVMTALSDASAPVAKAAREAVLRRPYLLTPDRLWPIYEASKTAHGRRIALSLIAELPWWDSAAMLVSASASVDEDIRRRTVAYLERWERNCERLSRRPTRDQIAALEAALTANERFLTHRVRQDVRSLLSYAVRDSAQTIYYWRDDTFRVLPD